jgi:ATP-binding cassette subfamily B protein
MTSSSLTPHLAQYSHARTPQARWLRWRRVPVIRPQHAAEDGVVCLAMVFASFGKPHTLAQCRVACMPARDGITAEHLLEASRTMGLWAEDWVVQGADAFDTFLSLPAIVSWHEHHFVVVERITSRHVILVDPSIGRRRLTRELFDRFCSGVAVTFENGGGETRRALGSIASLVREAFATREARWMTGLLIASTILLQICSLALPIGTLLVLDHILSVGLEPSLSLMVTVILLVVASHAILRFVRSQALVYLRMEVEARWRHRVLSRVFPLPCRGLDALSGQLVSQPIVVCLHAWFVIVSLVLVGAWSPPLAALALSVVCMQVCVAAWATRRLRSGIEKELAADLETRVEFSTSRQRLGSVVDGLVSGMGLCSLLGLLVLGAHEVVAGRLTMAGMLAMNVVAAGALIPVGEMTRDLQQFLMARARFERLREREGWR